MPFPDPFDDPDRPAWREVAEAIEYAIVAILLIGAWAYGIYCGVKSLF